METDIDYKFLWKRVREMQIRESTIHGYDHWSRVEKNGLMLRGMTGANEDVVRLFAIFHDSQRHNDGHDPEHGRRGAELARTFRGPMLKIPDSLFALLEQACIYHTEGRYHPDPTIGTCWDADRLDLTRLGMRPNPDYMSTDFGKEIARAGGVNLYEYKRRQQPD